MTTTINMYPSEIGSAWAQDVMGGVRITIQIHPEIADIILWVKEFKEQLQREADARDKHPSLASCYYEYQTMLKLVSD